MKIQPMPTLSPSTKFKYRTLVAILKFLPQLIFSETLQSHLEKKTIHRKPNKISKIIKKIFSKRTKKKRMVGGASKSIGYKLYRKTLRTMAERSLLKE